MTSASRGEGGGEARPPKPAGLGTPSVLSEVLATKSQWSQARFVGRARGQLTTMAVSRRGSPRLWSDGRIAAELRAYADELGHRPTQPDLQNSGRQALMSAMIRHGGFAHHMAALADLPAAPVRRRPSVGPRAPGREGPLKWTPDVLEAGLRGYTAGRESFPTAEQMTADGRTDLRHAVRKYGGVVHWSQILDLPLTKGQDRTPYSAEEAVAEARRLIDEFGRLPGIQILRKRGHPRLASFIDYRCGKSVRRFVAEYLS